MINVETMFLNEGILPDATEVFTKKQLPSLERLVRRQGTQLLDLLRYMQVKNAAYSSFKGTRSRNLQIGVNNIKHLMDIPLNVVAGRKNV